MIAVGQACFERQLNSGAVSGGNQAIWPTKKQKELDLGGVLQ
jgi:hypothetical protein